MPFDQNKSEQTNLSTKLKPIHEHLHTIALHYKKMKMKAGHNVNYRDAASEAETLLQTCIDAMIQVYKASDKSEVQIEKLKNTCSSAIQTAKPVLKKHRGWGKALGASGIFSVKTKSEQLLDKFQHTLNQTKS